MPGIIPGTGVGTLPNAETFIRRYLPIISEEKKPEDIDEKWVADMKDITKNVAHGVTALPMIANKVPTLSNIVYGSTRSVMKGLAEEVGILDGDGIESVFHDAKGIIDFYGDSIKNTGAVAADVWKHGTDWETIKEHPGRFLESWMIMHGLTKLALSASGRAAMGFATRKADAQILTRQLQIELPGMSEYDAKMIARKAIVNGADPAAIHGGEFLEKVVGDLRVKTKELVQSRSIAKKEAAMNPNVSRKAARDILDEWNKKINAQGMYVNRMKQFDNAYSHFRANKEMIDIIHSTPEHYGMFQRSMQWAVGTDKFNNFVRNVTKVNYEARVAIGGQAKKVVAKAAENRRFVRAYRFWLDKDFGNPAEFVRLVDRNQALTEAARRQMMVLTEGMSVIPESKKIAALQALKSPEVLDTAIVGQKRFDLAKKVLSDAKKTGDKVKIKKASDALSIAGKKIKQVAQQG